MYSLLIWDATGKIVEDFSGSMTSCYRIMDRYKVGPLRDNDKYFYTFHLR